MQFTPRIHYSFDEIYPLIDVPLQDEMVNPLH